MILGLDDFWRFEDTCDVGERTPRSENIKTIGSDNLKNTLLISCIFEMSATAANKKIPPLTKISQLEAEAILNMFNMYDYTCTGRIPKRLVLKLLSSLGFNGFAHEITAPEMTLTEILLFLDLRHPDPEPPMDCAMWTFLNLTSNESFTEKGRVITPTDLSNFMVSLGRPPCSTRKATLLLSSMLEYDDCAKLPAAPVEAFEKDVVKFAKKNNLMRDFR